MGEHEVTKAAEVYERDPSSVDEAAVATSESLEEKEVFGKAGAEVDFRTVGWPMASVIFFKLMFSTGVLSIPTAFASLGALGGSLSVIGWGGLNTYTAYILGKFRNNHRQCHTVVDMAYLVGGSFLRELVSIIYLIGFVLVSGSGILGVSIGINTLSTHAACTVWWSFLATVVTASVASIRTFHNLGWATWAGCASIFVAVLIVVVGVTTLDRPAAAPQTGDFDLGYSVIAHPTFIAGMTASATIFISSSGTSSFMPVIAEMKNPKDYNKALFTCMGVLNSAYLAFSLVVYRWCGAWVANPSLGSAGPVMKMAAYGVGLIGLVVSACVYLHVAAKYLFVRILRNSKHLQANSVIHWGVWLSCTFGLSSLAFILASAIPIFNFLLALTGSICFAPLALILPMLLWFHDYRHWVKGSAKQKCIFGLHIFIVLVGSFLSVGGTYSTVKQIIDAYATGIIGSAFSCADNSNSV
ncbi:neutral amino acid permease [Sarocladium strictum]